ncbi:MAG: asparaginase, partial [Ideonella sp.]
MQNIDRKLVVLGTGGTIAGTSADRSDHTGYRAGSLAVSDLLRDLSGVDAVAIESEQLAQIDSKDMDHATWQSLARRVAHHLARADVGAVVITHGTDTLEETAYFLHRVLPADKPVVLTAAMRPASALHPDGPQNLLDALVVANEPVARGVVAVIAGQVIGAADLRKLHPYRLDAFGSGDAGSIGIVEQGRLRRFRDWPQRVGATDQTHPALVIDSERWPWVEIVTSHAGADRRIIDLLVDARVGGLVIAATGNGTVHRAWESALERAIQAGVSVVRSTRCAFGALVGDGSDGLLQAADGC